MQYLNLIDLKTGHSTNTAMHINLYYYIKKNLFVLYIKACNEN